MISLPIFLFAIWCQNSFGQIQPVIISAPISENYGEPLDEVETGTATNDDFGTQCQNSFDVTSFNLESYGESK